MVSLGEMGVYIERDADATVSELLLDIFGIGSLLNKQGCESVPEVMKAYPAQVGLIQAGAKGFPYQFIAHPLAGRTEEDPLGQRCPLNACF